MMVAQPVMFTTSPKRCNARVAMLTLAVLTAATAALGAPLDPLPTADFPTSTAGQNPPDSFSTRSPYTALTPLVTLQSTPNDVGRINWFAGNFAIRGTAIADGSELDISTNQELFAKIGTTYGGDGTLKFNLPDLRGRAAVGTSPTRLLGSNLGQETQTLTFGNVPEHTHSTPNPNVQVLPNGNPTPTPVDTRNPTLAVNYSVASVGIFPTRNSVNNPPTSTTNAFGDEDLLGIVRMDAGAPPSPGTQPANGQTISIDQNQSLFSILGTTYGGDGRTTFGIPDLQDRQPVGKGSGPGLTTVSLGQKFGIAEKTLSEAEMPRHNHELPFGGGPTGFTGGSQTFDSRDRSLGLNYIIALQGLFPSRNSIDPGQVNSLDPTTLFASGIEPFLGQVELFAGNFAPRGWALAEGQLLPIAQNTALFSILGTRYGGDGSTTFGLPDLRGRTAIGWGQGPGLSSIAIGSRSGIENTQLLEANLPLHQHTAVPLPAPVLMLMAGLALLVPLRRRSTA